VSRNQFVNNTTKSVVKIILLVYNGLNMLEVFITSRVRRKIVMVYAKYPDFKTHIRGLAKLIKEDPGNIQRELKRLVESDFLLVEQKGSTKLYATNKNFPIFKELQAIVIKSQQLATKNKKKEA